VKIRRKANRRQASKPPIKQKVTPTGQVHIIEEKIFLRPSEYMERQAEAFKAGVAAGASLRKKPGRKPKFADALKSELRGDLAGHFGVKPKTQDIAVTYVRERLAARGIDVPDTVSNALLIERQIVRPVYKQREWSWSRK
jgi:hypothetical protein